MNQGLGKDGNFNVASEDSGAATDNEVPAEDPNLTPEGFPVRLEVTITKDGTQGALFIESIVRDGQITTEHVHYFPNADLAEGKTAEQDYARRNLYTGPPFSNLDEDVQISIDQYIAERGIDTALALWVPEYMDFKEQREYVNWLQCKWSWFAVCDPANVVTRYEELRRCLASELKRLVSLTWP